MSAIDLVILGIVLEKPQSAYDIQKDVEYHRFPMWTKVSIPSIYRKVIQLNEKGYLKSDIIKGERFADKAIYSITDKGKDYFEQAYGERLARFCQVSAVSKGFYPVNGTYEPAREVFEIEVKQTPAFLMMVLADLASSNCHILENGHDKIVEYNKNSSRNEQSLFGNSLGFYVAPAYSSAKNNFVHSAMDTVFESPLGGMVHAHTPDTYYFLSNDYKGKLELDEGGE